MKDLNTETLNKLKANTDFFTSVCEEIVNELQLSDEIWEIVEHENMGAIQSYLDIENKFLECTTEAERETLKQEKLAKLREVLPIISELDLSI